MEITLKLEELVMFGLGIFAFNQLDFAWWWFLVLILTPDIGMLGYLVNSILFAHAALDWSFGYRLKYQTSFNDTHLGPLE